MTDLSLERAAPKHRTVVGVDIGGGFGLMGFEIRPVLVTGSEEDGEPDLHAVLWAVGGRTSELVPMKTVGVPICPLGGVKLVDLRAKLAEALKPAS